MRSHLLAELQVEGKEAVLEVFPGFDFYNLRRAVSFVWAVKRDPLQAQSTANFILTAEYEESIQGTSSLVRLHCCDVTYLRVPEITGSFFLGELDIEDTSGDQLEGIRYRIKDFLQSNFEVLCRDIQMSICDSED